MLASLTNNILRYGAIIATLYIAGTLFTPPKAPNLQEHYSCTGFFINDQGVMATAAHCTTGTIYKIKYNNQFISGQVIGRDTVNDVALIATTARGTPYVPLSLSYSDGEAVKIYGYPDPSYFGYNLKIVSGSVKHSTFSSYIESTFVTCPGNSGSPVIDANGGAIGVLHGAYSYGSTGVAQCSTAGLSNPTTALADLAAANGIHFTVLTSSTSHTYNENEVVLFYGE